MSQNFYNKQVNFMVKFEQTAAGINTPQYVGLKNLVKGQSYNCSNFRFIKTKFGVSLAVDLADENLWVILPARLSSLVKDKNNLKTLNSINYTMIYNGQDVNAGNRHLLKFEVVSEDMRTDNENVNDAGYLSDQEISEITKKMNK